MSRFLEIPESYILEEFEEEFEEESFSLKNTIIENVIIKINTNNKLYWDNDKLYNGTLKNSCWSGINFTNSYWKHGNFYGENFINSYWDSGIFQFGIFKNSYWNNGRFCGERFENSYWENGYIENGIFINSIIKKIDENNKFEDYSKAKFYNCIILEPKLLELDRIYTNLSFKGIK